MWHCVDLVRMYVMFLKINIDTNGRIILTAKLNIFVTVSHKQKVN